MSGKSGRAATFMLVLLLIAGIGGVLWWVFGSGEGTTPAADLYSVTSDVTRQDARSGARETVPASQHRDMFDGDRVTVDTSGRARLDLSGGVMEIYRTTELAIEPRADLTVPVSAIQLTHGAIVAVVNGDTTVGTDWAEVTIRGTECLAYVNDQIGLLWVVVRSGTVEIEAAGTLIVVSGGEQAWVWRGEPPVGPVPAWRSEVPDLDVFPLIPDLTNGELPDDHLLGPGEPDQPGVPGLELEPSTDEVVSGDCDGPHTLAVVARLTGEDDAVARVAELEFRYGWDGVAVDAFAMGRLDDRTFSAEITPDYDGAGTKLVYAVTVLAADGSALVIQEDVVVLRACPVIATVIPFDPSSLVPGVTVTQDVARLYAGECKATPGVPLPTSVTITATLTGSDFAISRVATAEVVYEWPDGPSATASMKRVDDRTFQVTIEPTFVRTSVLFYTVTVRDSGGNALASNWWSVALESCPIL